MVAIATQTLSKSGSVRRELSPRSRRQPYNRVTWSLRGNAPGPGNLVDLVASKRRPHLRPWTWGFNEQVTTDPVVTCSIFVLRLTFRLALC